MITTQENRIAIEETPGHETDVGYSPVHQSWVDWPVHWSAVFVGALASLAAIVVFGLISTALGLHLVGPENRVVDLTKVGMITFAFSIFSAFLAAVLGGWVSGTIAGFRRAEPAMLHGAITWLVAIPLVVALAALGAGAYLGGWYGGLAGTPSWAAYSAAPYDRPDFPAATASPDEWQQYSRAQAEYRDNVRKWREETPRATRNAALGAVTALLLGLMGSVVGGWMASGEPMTLTYYRTRERRAT
jgi:hypothetical protein